MSDSTLRCPLVPIIVKKGEMEMGATLLMVLSGKDFKVDADGLVYELDDDDLETPIATYDWELRQVDM